MKGLSTNPCHSFAAPSRALPKSRQQFYASTTSLDDVVSDMYQRPDKTVRGYSHTEEAVMRELPEHIMYDIFHDVATKYTSSKDGPVALPPEDDILESMTLEQMKCGLNPFLRQSFSTRIWREHGSSQVILYYLSEMYRLGVDNEYRSPLFEYKGNVPVLNAEGEAMLYDMFRYGCRVYGIEDRLFEVMASDIFWDSDWEIDGQNMTPKMLDDFGIDIGYFTPTSLVEIQNFDESMEWLYNRAIQEEWYE